MNDVKCSRGACQQVIRSGETVYYIRNQPQFSPPNDHRPYCRDCGRKITGFAAETNTGLTWRVTFHGEDSTTAPIAGNQSS